MWIFYYRPILECGPFFLTQTLDCIGHFLVNISDITHTRLRDARTLEISKARPENQASVSVYHEKMLGGNWHIFEFHQV